jgi:diguanylate cyclase (GGDEF)-like protein/PAS domain S-box-containing protein
MVLVGAGFMFFSVLYSARMLKSVPPVFLTSWKVLTALMFFFLGGYLTFVVGQFKRFDLSTELVSGIIFLGGSVFVFLIINLTNKTIAKIREGEQLLRNARDDLEVRVEQRTEQLKQTLADLEKEVGERQKASVALETAHAELLQILNSAADGIRVVDKKFIIRRVNRTFAQMAGIAEEDLVGMPCHEVFRNSACHTGDCSLESVLQGAPFVENEKLLKRKDGRVFPCIVTAFPYRSPDGELIGIVEGFRDISQRKEMENRLKEMSITDELTGLLNRRGFVSIAEKHLQLVDRVDKFLYLLYLDLDNMKGINDNFGHDTGDQALIETAGVLRATLRKSDVVGIGRLGGDEFAVLMFSSYEPCCDHPVVRRLQEHLAERNAMPGRTYQLALSVGVALYDPEKPCSVEEFLAMGDAAMYACKKGKKAEA